MRSVRGQSPAWRSGRRAALLLPLFCHSRAGENPDRLAWRPFGHRSSIWIGCAELTFPACAGMTIPGQIQTESLPLDQSSSSRTAAPPVSDGRGPGCTGTGAAASPPPFRLGMRRPRSLSRISDSEARSGSSPRAMRIALRPPTAWAFRTDRSAAASWGSRCPPPEQAVRPRSGRCRVRSARRRAAS